MEAKAPRSRRPALEPHTSLAAVNARHKNPAPISRETRKAQLTDHILLAPHRLAGKRFTHAEIAGDAASSRCAFANFFKPWFTASLQESRIWRSFR